MGEQSTRRDLTKSRKIHNSCVNHIKIYKNLAKLGQIFVLFFWLKQSHFVFAAMVDMDSVRR